MFKEDVSLDGESEYFWKIFVNNNEAEINLNKSLLYAKRWDVYIRQKL